MSPSSLMQRRLSETLQIQLHKVDFIDVDEKRQFAPEYSQSAYDCAKEAESRVGDYMQSES